MVFHFGFPLRNPFERFWEELYTLVCQGQFEEDLSNLSIELNDVGKVDLCAVVALFLLAIRVEFFGKFEIFKQKIQRMIHVFGITFFCHFPFQTFLFKIVFNFTKINFRLDDTQDELFAICSFFSAKLSRSNYKTWDALRRIKK